MSETKPSRLSVISIIIPILVLIGWCAYTVGFGFLIENSSQLDTGDGELLGFAYLLGGAVLGMVVTVLLLLAGLILGIVALRKKDSRRNLAIAGVAVNLLCILPYLALFVFMLVSELQTGG